MSVCPGHGDVAGSVRFVAVAAIVLGLIACAPRPARRAIVPDDDAGENEPMDAILGAGGRDGAGDETHDASGEPDAAAEDAPAPAMDLAAPDAASDLAPDAALLELRDAGRVTDAPPGVDLGAGLVYRWRFDEGMATTTADSSGTGNNGTLTGGPTWVSPGAFPGSPFALSFDGTNAYVATKIDLAPVLGGTASLSCWIKTTQKGADNSFDAPGITGVEMTGGSNDIFWGFIDASGYIGLRPGAGGTVKSAAPINDNMWHNVVMTRDATSARIQIFVDGKLAKGADGQQGGAKSTAFAALGRITNSSKPYYKGLLDDVRVWSRVLSAAEVAALYAGD